jgi:hypothetical protein
MLRTFKNDVCSAYCTYDLPQEEAARGRREVAAAKKAASLPGATHPKAKSSTGRREHKFSLDTYKIHALGDYAHAIRLFGTTDNYNSQTVNNQINSCFSF